ncbi:MAG: hypothetical protein KDA27_05835 [Candidatus Eisenbacteria bacterium]|uniref:Uncharacterized protein n=1 Tax=Eiseniibacteriota bacterium TaxID=2212470 RepID=A0A956N9Y7_UNCEI|nr:hypothetical protein [Candidatus Eisenbacteria bacterium]MCB9466098.1 hypothetical protein [Candidatus Eisenbacteria bacterium]
MLDQLAQREFPARPIIVATGFSTCLLGDERTLREFVIGDQVRQALSNAGHNVLLYLINDTYDPLDYRQLRVGVNKDPGLIERYAPFCGMPIAEIPDPFGCHSSYADHFADAWMARLRSLDIHPVLIDSHRAYKRGHYATYIHQVLEQYAEIQESVAHKFDGEYTLSQLFRVQCPTCRHLDQTELKHVENGEVTFSCERCNHRKSLPMSEIEGKLHWKIDCAARWNLYRIDVETFSKPHCGRLGTLRVARHLSKEFFGGAAPQVASYGAVNLSRDLSGKLLDTLPPQILKAMFAETPRQDLVIRRDTVENFCRREEFLPSVTYAGWVRQVLPILALKGDPDGLGGHKSVRVVQGRAERESILLGNNFSQLFYNRSFGVQYPAFSVLETADTDAVEAAVKVLDHALALRQDATADQADTPGLVKDFLRDVSQDRAPYVFLRDFMNHKVGAHVSTAIATVPVPYLEMLRDILQLHLRSEGAVVDFGKEEHDEETRAAA